jgi:Putative auto-transporter adhesin, head GIN domain
MGGFMKSAIRIMMALASTIMTSHTYAQVLDISACHGVVVVQQLPVLTPALREVGAILSASADGWRLSCQASGRQSSSPSSSQQVNIAGARINSAVGSGAVATQNIGGRSSNSTASESEKQIHVSVPKGWLLKARAWVGTLTAKEGVWRVDVELAAGEMSFGNLQQSKVVVDAGSVSIDEIQGAFEAELRGAGSIEAAGMRAAALQLRLSGAGSMSFAGKAQSARIHASGVGSIEIEHVLTEPLITARGLTTIDIGR